MEGDSQSPWVKRFSQRFVFASVFVQIDFFAFIFVQAGASRGESSKADLIQNFVLKVTFMTFMQLWTGCASLLALVFVFVSHVWRGLTTNAFIRKAAFELCTCKFKKLIFQHLKISGESICIFSPGWRNLPINVLYSPKLVVCALVNKLSLWWRTSGKIPV